MRTPRSPFLFILASLLAAIDGLAAPVITATQDDATLATTRKLVGDTITYTTTISNTAAVIIGSTANDATAVLLTNPTPANTTDSGVIAISPIAFDDTYPQTVIGNVSINSASIPYSVVTNDPQGQNGGAVTITAFDATTTAGGQVVMTTSGASIGRFTYNPPPGFEGTDTFTYTLTNSVGSSVGTVRIPVSGMVWFINSSAPTCTTLAGGCGRLSNPFSTMAAFAGLNNGSGNNPASGDNIFLYSGTYPTGLTLLGTQRLVGQGAVTSLAAITGLSVPSGSAALPGTGGARPIIGVAAGTGITLASGNTVNGLNVTNSAGSGITGSAVGTLTLADFDVTVTNGFALSLTTSGTVTATGADNDLGSTNGTALNVNAVTIAAAGLTFKSISSSGGSATGIILDTTGSLGGLTVTGDGTNTSLGGNSTGGTIANKTGTDGNPATGSGIYLNATRNVTLRRLTINGTNQNYGIRGIGVSAFVMEYCTIAGSNGTNQATPFNEGSIFFAELTGTSAIKSSDISGGFQRNVFIDNSTGNVDLTVNACSIHNSSAAQGDDGLAIEIGGTGASNLVHVTNNTFSSHGGGHFDFTTLDSPTVAVVFTGNNGSPGSPVHPIGLGQNFRIFGAAFNGTLTYDMSNNTINGTKQGGAITVNKGSGTGTFSGRVSGNTIGIAGQVLSGASQSNGINVESRGGGTHTTLVTGNTVRQYREYGINIEGAEAGTTTFNVTCTANNIDEPGSPGAAGLSLHGIQLNWGIDVGNTSICLLDLGGAGAARNIVTNGGNEPAGGVDIRLRQRQSTTVRLLNYGGAANDNAAVQAYITGRNTLTTVAASNTVPTGQGYLSTASVPQPTLPLLFAPGGPGATEVVSAATEADDDVDLAVQEDRATAIPSAGSRVTPQQALDSSELSQAQLNEVVALATSRWEATGLTEEQRGVLHSMKFETADLPGLRLGEANSKHIRVDSNAAGNAWFIDRDRDSLAPADLRQRPEVSPHRVDLLTTIMHEMGHALGLSDSYLEQDRANVMYGFLSKGERRLPAEGQALGAKPNEKSGPHFLASPVNLGTLPPGKTVKVVYSVTVGPITGNPQNVSSQAVISGGGFSNVNAVDAIAGSGATVTLLGIAPSFTSANAATFTVGSAGTFGVSANGAPGPAYSFTGTLPGGVNLSAVGLLSGTPAAGTGGTYPITITANNGVAPNAQQSFTLTVNQAPAITSANATTFVVGSSGTFTVTKTGFPVPTLTQTGTLPSGVTFTPGTGVLSGIPDPATGGTYPISFKAANGVGSDAVQSFTLTVNQAPAITSVNTATFTVGTAGTFNVTATGFPSPAINLTNGTLPAGVNFGTGTLAGTPTAFGTFPLTFTASNGVGSNAVQSFSLVVNPSASSVKGGGNIAKDPGGYKINFLGNPGVQYTVQFSPSLTSPNWQTLELKIADPQGMFFSIDSPPVGTTPRFYRAIIP